MVAWDLIGFGGAIDGRPADVRIIGGTALYEAVDYNDDTPGCRVRLARLEVTADGFRQINRYVDPDTPLEIVYV